MKGIDLVDIGGQLPLPAMCRNWIGGYLAGFQRLGGCSTVTTEKPREFWTIQ
jgi:hypothetical protein